MCGITGFISNNSGDLNIVCERMVQSLNHRGPDDHGVWSDRKNGIVLGHARLSIIDLSPEGHQPMSSNSGRYVIAFNGEIYNFQSLRKELVQVGISFRGHSDTEVLLAAIECWGFERGLEKCVGMFAIALWDKKERSLSLARDRVGEKPLYYGLVKGAFVFGSELKALKKHDSWVGDIDRNSLSLYLRHNYIPAPYSIYKGIKKIKPGTFVTVYTEKNEYKFHETVYWSSHEMVEKGILNPLLNPEAEIRDGLESVIRTSIREKMISDVPLGAFLSGGYDSSLVVALMQQESSRSVKTFSIGFHEDGYNEAQHAKKVAAHIGTDHTELYITPEQAMDVIPKIPQFYDEPFSDSSQIPTYLVSAMTKEHVTVALSGDAGDEIFGGYNRYLMTQALWNKLDRIPGGIRSVAANIVTVLSPATWERIISTCYPLLPKKFHYKNPGDKMHKLAGLLSLQSPEALYHSLVSHWSEPADIVIGGKEYETILTSPEMWPNTNNIIENMMYLDTVTYLPDDILVKVDRASMAVSLETRIPFLDHRVMEYAWRIPFDLKINSGNGKHILRQILYKYVPQDLVDRPKMGFGVPIDDWLRHSLRDWAEDLLSEERLKHEGVFNAGPIRKKWDEHLSGKRNWQYYLWDILMFQAWNASN